VTNYEVHSDEHLLNLAAKGDEDAFSTLYERRHPAVYRFALQAGGSPEVADEVTQEVFLFLLKHPGRYDAARGPLSAFLYGVARNYLRKCAADGRHAAMEEEIAVDAGQEADSDREKQVGRLRRAVLSLPEAYREAIVLCDLNEVSHAEAAVILGCSIGTIKSRLSRARALLAAKLGARPDSLGETRRCFA
jgi:RNA polymerase sigma-70 factor (ECF subfamily)